MIRCKYGCAYFRANLRPPFIGFVGLIICALSSAQEPLPNDPSSKWFRAFTIFETCLQNEKEGKYLEALNQCNEAKALYDGIAYTHPDFQPKMIEYKRRVVADTRLRIIEADKRAKAAIRNGGRPPTPAPSTNRNYPPPSRKGPTPITRKSEFPTIETPSSYNPNNTANGTRVNQPTVSEQQFYGPNGSNALPSWNTSRGVGAVSSQILQQMNEEQRQRESQLQWLTKENQRLQAERDAFENRLEDLQDELNATRQREMDYQRQLALISRNPNSQNAESRARQYKALLDETMKELRASTALNAKLVNQLRAARERIKIQDQQIKQLRSERDSLANVIQGKGLGSEALRDLMDQNRKLAQRLDLAEKLAQKTSGDAAQKEKDIEMLKSEIGKVRIERDRLVSENIRHQQQIDSLHQKLKLLSDGLSEDDKQFLAAMPEEQREENELLRSMVLKQLRRQAQLKQAKELLLRQLDRVGARSEALMEVVEDMAKGPQLTPKEKALFRSPQFAELATEIAPLKNADPNLMEEHLDAPANPNAKNGQKKMAEELALLDKAARLDFKEGRLAEAETGFLRYLHFQPRSVPCLCNLGVLKIALKEFDEARNYLQKAVAIDRSSGLGHYLLGRTFFLEQNFDNALPHLEESIKLKPNNANAHNCVGVIASQKGWIGRAEKAFGSAVKINPKHGDAHFNLAVLYTSESLPNPSRAGEHYFKALDLGVPRDATIEAFLKQAAEQMELGLL